MGDTLPYLNPIVERLLKLLDPARVGRNVPEQTITTLAMVAGASEVTFAKVLPVWEKGRRNWTWTRTHLWSCLCGNGGCRITANAKADISLYCVSPPTISLPATHVHGTDEEEKIEDRDGWETILMDGRTIDIRMLAIEEKSQRTRRSLYIAQF